MPYPVVDAPYGFKPINLIGGQVFAGSTRNIPIQYNFGTNIFYGDVVGTARGFITRSIVTTGASAITGSAGIDNLFGNTATASSVSGGTGADSITGGSGGDTLLGGAGADSIVAGGGNDSIDAGAGC